MDTWLWIVIAVVVVLVVIALVAWLTASRRRHRQLRDRFGPEYDHTVDSADSRRKAERDLRERENARERFETRPLSDASRERYTREWQDLQARFVDRPMTAVTEADELVTEVMRERGYPVDDFDTRTRLVSVDHPDLMDHYRSGHDVATKARREDASTEELRQAVIHYRALFEELLHEGAERPAPSRAAGT